MTPLLLAVTIGASVLLAIWALRERLVERWERDVGWLQDRIWHFTPEPFDARPWVAGYYVAAAVSLFLVLGFLPAPPLGFAIWLVLLAVPRLALARAWKKRQKQIEDQLPGAIRQMASSVSSGMTLMQAIERLAERSPRPIDTEFRIVTNYWRMGSDFTASIEEAKHRLGLRNFDLFASAILVNQRMGGDVTETLEKIADSLEAVERMRREVHAATAEGRTNIKVLAVAPFIMLAFDAVIDAEAVGWLFTRPVGHLLLLAAVLLTAAGTFWAWRTVHADV